MVLKTHFKKSFSRGFTIVEILVVVSVLFILFSALFVLLNPTEQLKKGRDVKRLNDLSILDRALNEYRTDNGTYPDTDNTLRDSITLPVGQTNLTNSSSGWIVKNLSSYTSRLPIDPLNTSTYKYQYIHSGDTYEIDAKFEYYSDQMQADSGDNPAMYEIGNKLTLIN